MACRTFLQVAETASQDKEVLGHYRECGPNTNKCGYHHLLFGSHLQHDMHLERSTYEVLQILIISLTDKTPLQELFKKTNFIDVKDQLNPLIPGLFD